MFPFIQHSFVGIYSVFAIIFLLQYFTYLRIEYAVYGFYLITIAVYYACFSTLIISDSLLWSIDFSDFLKHELASLGILFYTLFLLYFLSIKAYSTHLYKVMLWFIGIVIFGLVFYYVLYALNIPHRQLYYGLNILFAPLSFYILYRSVQLKIPYTIYILIGSIINIVGGITSITLSMFELPYAFVPGQCTILIDVVLFFYATQKKAVGLQANMIQLEYKAITELQEERQRISLELHDEVGGGLSTIHLLSEMSKHNPIDVKQLEKISHNSKDLVQKMNEIVWALNIKNDNLLGTIAYIRQYVVQALDDMHIACKVQVDNSIPNLNVDGKYRRALFLILKELTNNIIKHSHATIVHISISYAHHKLSIIITDDGIGFNIHNVKHNNFGISGLKARVLALQGTIDYNTTSGTSTTILLPMAVPSYKSGIF